MLNLKIEGFTVQTDINEARPYIRMYDKEDATSFEGEIIGLVIPVIEEMIIGGKSCASFFYDHSRGYKQRSLEPYNWRETKKSVKIIYTGAQGGDEYQIEIFKS